MIRENFTFWREINKLSKLGKFGASQLQTDPPFQKKKEPCIGHSIITWIDINFSSNLKLQACNPKKMTLHIPNDTILTAHRTINQNQKQNLFTQPQFSSQTSSNSKPKSAANTYSHSLQSVPKIVQTVNQNQQPTLIHTASNQ